MSISKRDLGNLYTSLNVSKGSKDEMIVSISDVMLDIIRDLTSDIVELIDSDDNIKIIV